MYASKFSIFAYLRRSFQVIFMILKYFLLISLCLDRSSRGGGVVIAVNSLFHSLLIHSPPHLEVISVGLEIKQDIVLCTVYILQALTNYYNILPP